MFERRSSRTAGAVCSGSLGFGSSRSWFATCTAISFVLALCCLSVDASAVPPANDICANAILVTVGSTVAGSTTDATSDVVLTGCQNGQGAPGVWYKVVGTGGFISAHTCNPGTDYDTQISVFSGSCAALTCVVADDLSCGTAAATGWFSTMGTTYFIVVHGSFDTGNFELSIESGFRSAQPGTCYAFGYDSSLDQDDLLTIDVATGAGTFAGRTAWTWLTGLAINSAGQIFGASYEQLYRIDAPPVTAVFIGSGAVVLEGIAFDENDVLYGVGTLVAASDVNVLVTIDTATGAANVVGSLDDHYVGLAFDPADGRLYASTGGGGGGRTIHPDRIALISKTTGAATVLGTTGLGGATHDLVFVGGELYGSKGGFYADNKLISINKTTGAGTEIGLIGWRSVNAIAANSACDCPALPADDKAAFKVGTPVFVAPDKFDVPLLVNTVEATTFTQMTLEYQSACLTYIADSAVPGGDVTNAGSVFADVVDLGGGNRRILLNMSGQYTGCDQEVFVLQFQRTGTGSCALSWDETFAGPNSNNHLNYDNSTGGDGKITPQNGGITFCDGVICDPSVKVHGNVTYFSNATSIVAARPDMTSVAVTVEDCDDQIPTTTATSPNGYYSLTFGVGPQAAEICSSRPMAACGSLEDGVISGDDVIALQNDVAPPPSTTDPKLRIAGDVNRDGAVNATDVIAIKRWIGRKVCDGTDACGQPTNNNCAANWTFIYLTGVGPDGFEKDVASLGSICVDKTVPVQGILVGDFDGSWPNFFVPKANSVVDLALEARPGDNGEVEVALRTDLDAGESLRHIIYSLNFDETAFEYLGMQPGSAAANWGSFDNPDIQGEAHGIAHIPPQAEALAESGEIIVFRFRPRHQDARSTISFTRLKANDIDVQVPEIEITSNGDATTVTTPLPTRYSVASHPNPFNPRTRVTYTIPAGVDRVPVELRVFDIAGRLVRTLESTERAPGRYVVDWDGKNDAGASTGTGIYLLRISAGEWSEVEKLTLVK